MKLQLIFVIILDYLYFRKAQIIENTTLFDSAQWNKVLLNIDTRSREYMDKMADLVRMPKAMGWLYS
tara:strand:- start:13592 stop:13792 length:201 start_codon:yes stop_codon:yes gene_type:complete